MKTILFVISLLLANSLFSQRLEDYADFHGFDTLKVEKEWQYYREYHNADTVKYELRFKMWGKGCPVPSGEDSKGKCKFYIQEQRWREDGSLIWKHGIWGHRKASLVKESQFFAEYSKAGKLVRKIKKKREYKP